MFWNEFQHLNDEALLNYYHTTRNLRAFRLLYERHKDALFRYCSQMNAGGAAQILEELWRDLLERPPELCGRLLHSWLFISVNKLLRKYIARGCGESTPEQTHTSSNALLSALQQLPRIERNIFLLHVECRLPLAVVADIERISLRLCRNHYHSGKERLEAILHGNERKPWRSKKITGDEVAV